MLPPGPIRPATEAAPGSGANKAAGRSPADCDRAVAGGSPRDRCQPGSSTGPACSAVQLGRQGEQLVELCGRQRTASRRRRIVQNNASARSRGDHSRLGYALMLCYLRYPGRPLRINERPPPALISFVAEQIDVRPEAIDDYLISGQNRRRHAAELQDRLRLRSFGRRPASELASSLLPHAIESDRLALPAELVIEECRQRGIIVPPPRSLERLCVDLRYQARRE